MTNRLLMDGARAGVLLLWLALGPVVCAEETNIASGAESAEVDRDAEGKKSEMELEGMQFGKDERGKYGHLQGVELWKHAQMRAEHVRPSQLKKLQMVWARHYMLGYDAAEAAWNFGITAGYADGQQRREKGLGIPTHKELDALAAEAAAKVPELPLDAHREFAESYKQTFKMGYRRDDPAW